MSANHCLSYFAAFVVTVAGIPVENEDEPLILTTEVPTLDGDAYNKMVGGCTFKELAHTMAKHRRRFYLSFRTDKTTSCKYEMLHFCFIFAY